MLDWLVRDHKIIENVSVLVTLAVAAWTLYEARARLCAAYKSAGIWISRIIAPEYKEANRKRREKVTKAKLRYLTRFGHKQEMECLSKVYSRLSTALGLIAYDAVLVVVMGFLFVAGIGAVLEKEILHEPLSSHHAHRSLRPS
jgi:hypothetical protein